MNLLPGEQTLRESGSSGSSLYFVLTTHRVRLKQQALGRGEIVSIMLDHVASCAVAQRSRPFILAIAALAVLAGPLLGLLVLRLRPQSADRRRCRGDRRHLGRGEPVHDPRRAGGLRRSTRRRRPRGGVRIAAFGLILVGAALIPAPVRAGEALDESAGEPETPTPGLA